jgi:hypothetical protein
VLLELIFEREGEKKQPLFSLSLSLLIMSDFAHQVWQSVPEDRAMEVFRRACISGVVFVASIRFGALLGGTLFRLHAAHVASSSAGFALVGASGALASLASGEFVSERVSMSRRHLSRTSLPFLERFRAVSGEWMRFWHGKDGRDAVKRACVAGGVAIACYRILGGRFRSAWPSDLRHEGAFARASLPALRQADYANSAERGAIAAFGQVFGCHSCGRKSGRDLRFIADHQPPNYVVAQRGFFHRMLGLHATQRYYAHCNACSQIQSHVVKQSPSRNDLVYHWRQVRAHDAAAMLGTLTMTALFN